MANHTELSGSGTLTAIVTFSLDSDKTPANDHFPGSFGIKASFTFLVCFGQCNYEVVRIRTSGSLDRNGPESPQIGAFSSLAASAPIL